MTEDGIAVEYLSVGANRHTAIADWSQDGLVAFGADCNIGVWQPQANVANGVCRLLGGHKDVVKAVKFLPKIVGESTSYLVSGADDQRIKLWKFTPQGEVVCLQTIHEHTAAINCIAVLERRDGGRQKEVIFATGAADASICVWAFCAGEARLLQTIKPRPKYFPLSLTISEIDDDGDVIALAAAGTRDIVQIFVSGSDPAPDFKLQATLTGHEGWIRSLDFTRENSVGPSDLILASASQDKYVRLWRIHQGAELPAAAANGSDPSMGAFLPGKSPSNKAHRLEAAGKKFSITFEALLLGHDDWIYSAKWYSNPSTGKSLLLSTSADNTLAIWEADASSGIWITTVRLGEISREKGATTATGSTGGFWTGLWSPDGSSIICLGRTGSWRRWDYNKNDDQWIQRIGIGGHTRAVTGITWSNNGDYLLSTSLDQTTRLHAPWEKEDSQRTWHEMARPQIHGYDLNCIGALGATQFVSGADEKLMRVFREPKAVAKLLHKLSKIGNTQIDSMPDAANMPVLGLSNKAIDAVDDDFEMEAANPETDRDALDPANVVRKSALEIDHPPFEDSLSRHTLWPEVEKLYGHGYEISCLAVSHDGKLIASACKASSINHAVIRIFETDRWTEIKPPLKAHTLTVTRLRFSLNDRYLLSVGRDRQWAVFERDDKDQAHYTVLETNPKGHSRMILDAAWAPTTDRLIFATAGRDKQIKIWRKENGGGIACLTTIPATLPVTAIDFLPFQTEQKTYVLATGTEGGIVAIHALDASSLVAASLRVLGPTLSLDKAILQLAWRPVEGSRELAIAGDDSSLRIYAFTE